MTRDELLAALLVERFGPTPRRRAQPVEYDDSDLTTARRRRELADAIGTVDDYETQRRGVA